MRAKKIIESVEFQRGKDPKNVLNIGRIRAFKEKCSELIFDEDSKKDNIIHTVQTGDPGVDPAERGFDGYIPEKGSNNDLIDLNYSSPALREKFPLDLDNVEVNAEKRYWYVWNYSLDIIEELGFRNYFKEFYITDAYGDRLSPVNFIDPDKEFKHTRAENSAANTFRIIVKSEYSGNLPDKLHWKSHYLGESISFERGKDPYKSLDIGMKPFTIHADYLVRFPNKIMIRLSSPKREEREEAILPESQAKLVLESMKSNPIKANSISVITGENYPDIPFDVHSIRYLKRHPKYKYIKYKGEYYEIPKRVNEAISFERGKDPKRTMGLGMMTIVLDFVGFKLDPEAYYGRGEIEPDMDDETTDSFVVQFNNIGVDWEIVIDDYITDTVKEIRFTGTISQIARVIGETWIGEDPKEVEKVLRKWDGKDKQELYDLLDQIF